jgi:hypothetical protein
LHKLNIKNDRELVELYRGLIVAKTQDQYRDKSREIIITALLKEVKRLRETAINSGSRSALLEKYLDFSSSGASHEFVIDSFRDADDAAHNEYVTQVLQKNLKTD